MSDAPRPAPWFAALLDAARQIRAHWAWFVGFGVLGGAVAAAVVLLLPSYYRAGAAFQAETTAPFQLSGALAGLASQLGGVSLAQQSNPHLFAELLETDAVLRRIASASYPWNGRYAPLATVFGVDDVPAGRREFRMVRRLRRALDVSVNIRTGVVRFSIEGQTPGLARALAESALVALDAANIALRQARARAERSFTSERAEHARNDLAAAESTLATFSERNRAISSSPTLQLEENRLRRAVDMAQQVYVQLRLQAEQAAVQELRNTPAISIVDPPTEPVRRSRPRRRLGVMIGFGIGVLLAATRLALARLSPASPGR